MKNENANLQQSDRINNYFVGPLNLDRITRQAVTAMGTQLELDKNEFDVLDILATNEGQFMTNRQLYKAAWGTPESDECENTARVVLESLMEQVNSVCGDFMWIECIPELGYTLRTRWGNNWKRNGYIKLHLSNLIGV